MEKKKLNILTLADETILQLWLVDRIACGMGYEYINAEYQLTFNNTFTEDDFTAFKDKYDAQIKDRIAEMKAQIKDANLPGRAMNVLNLIYTNLMTNDSNPREFSALANTLQTYINAVQKIGEDNTKKEKLIQNNYIFIKQLNELGYIDIKDDAKLRYIFDEEVKDAVQ